METVTGRYNEARRIVGFARGILHLNSPQALTALARATAIVLDELPDEGRELGVAAVIAVLKDRGFGSG